MAIKDSYILGRLNHIITDYILDDNLSVFNLSDEGMERIIESFRTKQVKGNKKNNITQEQREKQIKEITDEELKKGINEIIIERQGFKAFWMTYKKILESCLKSYFVNNEDKSIYAWNIVDYFLNDENVIKEIDPGYAEKMNLGFTREPRVNEGDMPGNKKIYTLIADIRKDFRNEAKRNPNVGYIIAASDVYDSEDDFPLSNGWKYTKDSGEINDFCKRQEVKNARAFLGNIGFLINKGIVDEKYEESVETLSIFIDKTLRELKEKDRKTRLKPR